MASSNRCGTLASLQSFRRTKRTFYFQSNNLSSMQQQQQQQQQ
eukprot:CAMPEP_0172827898 /NCGR_PEP_ID=MMETSP1075-20121228/20439_1 /TAXON_ID=2916 /ORGANISM="Ceratium fusus, Strain PA161109" /LENGTH=42 /DNA_ID= /DNA_START= /DNA_END= /DNA_ORIENTATION=